jgi:hypothetical protein
MLLCPGRGEEPPLNDCKVPFLRGRVQPNLFPEKYARENEYLRDMVLRRAGEVVGNDDEQVCERSLGWGVGVGCVWVAGAGGGVDEERIGSKGGRGRGRDGEREGGRECEHIS